MLTVGEGEDADHQEKRHDHDEADPQITVRVPVVPDTNTQTCYNLGRLRQSLLSTTITSHVICHCMTTSAPVHNIDSFRLLLLSYTLTYSRNKDIHNEISTLATWLFSADD